MRRLHTAVYGLGLVASPLLIVCYWVVYPAYGELHGADVFSSISAAPDRTHVADLLLLLGGLLAVAGALAYLRVLQDRSPRLGRVGVTATVVGWIAVLCLLPLDVVAAQPSTTAKVFEAVYGAPLVVGLNALAALHVIGGVLIGLALLRTRVIPRSLAMAGTAAPVVHLLSNINGVLWLDAATWLVSAVVGAAVLQQLLVALPTLDNLRLTVPATTT